MDEAEQGRHLLLRATGRSLVEVRSSGDVGGQPGVGEALGDAARADDAALIKPHGRAGGEPGSTSAPGWWVSCSFIGVPIFCSTGG